MSEVNKENLRAAGQVQIADEVITIIAGTAASEVEGVAAMTGKIGGGLTEFIGKKNLSKGVKVSIEGDEVYLWLDVTVKHGFKINDVALNLQKKVTTAIETMTGLTVKEVNVNINNIIVSKDKETDNKTDEKP